MEQELLQTLLIFFAGLVLGMLFMLLINKLRSGSASPGKVKQDYDDYKAQVESHFEETSNKFKDMTEQYQDLYKHLSVGATSLCRPDSVAAVGLANQSNTLKPVKLEQKAPVKPATDMKGKTAASADKGATSATAAPAASAKPVKSASDKPTVSPTKPAPQAAKPKTQTTSKANAGVTSKPAPNSTSKPTSKPASKPTS